MPCRISPAISPTRSTTGFKGIGTSFVDLIPDATTPNRQVAGGVTAFAQATISSQGTVSASTVGTYMAINGDGFFSVQKASGTVDNVPTFSGVTDYTRRGDFQVNANGNLVNGAGYYLMGVAVDPKTGNPLGNVPQVLQFQNNFVPAQATSSISVRFEPSGYADHTGKQHGSGRVDNGGWEGWIPQISSTAIQPSAVLEQCPPMTSRLFRKSRSAVVRSRPTMQPEPRLTCSCDGPKPTAPRLAPGVWTPGTCFTRPTPVRRARRSSGQNVGTAFKFGPNGSSDEPGRRFDHNSRA